MQTHPLSLNVADVGNCRLIVSTRNDDNGRRIGFDVKIFQQDPNKKTGRGDLIDNYSFPDRENDPDARLEELTRKYYEDLKDGADPTRLFDKEREEFQRSLVGNESKG